jgi:hypothetical protein
MSTSPYADLYGKKRTVTSAVTRYVKERPTLFGFRTDIRGPAWRLAYALRLDA